MKYDASKTPVGFDDKPLQDEMGNPATFRAILVQCCNIDGSKEEKMARFALFMKVKKTTGAFIDLSAEEVGMLAKDAWSFPPIIAGQIAQWLENPDGSRDKDSSSTDR